MTRNVMAGTVALLAIGAGLLAQTGGRPMSPDGSAQAKFNPQDQTALWGAYGYTPDKDVARIPMTVETLPFGVEQLTWSFLDMTNDSGRLAIMWGKTMASAPFKTAAAP